MASGPTKPASGTVTLQPVNRDNWRDIVQLKVTEAQYEFVSEPAYYLALCCYGELWHPLAIYLDTVVIGFLMWAVDPEDGSCWLGGILVDHRYQGRGYGRQAIRSAISMLAAQHGHQSFALSYQPANTIAKQLYQSLGFTETDEWEDDEIVARMVIAPKPDLR